MIVCAALVVLFVWVALLTKYLVLNIRRQNALLREIFDIYDELKQFERKRNS